jgi:hypothetical protein
MAITERCRSSSAAWYGGERAGGGAVVAEYLVMGGLHAVGTYPEPGAKPPQSRHLSLQMDMS